MRLARQQTLTSLDEAEIEDVVAAVEDDEEGAPPLPRCAIDAFGRRPDPGKDVPILKITYSVYADEEAEQAPAPAVDFHYVTEAKGGNRTIKRIACSRGGKMVPLEKGTFTDTIRRKMPGGARFNLSVAERKSGNVEKVIFWRLVLRYEDKVVAVKESRHTAVKKELPANWWK
jgi:hypothetical protein